jgi:hypothetical protein
MGKKKFVLKFKEETSEMLHLEHGFVWCWNLDASGSRSEISVKFSNVVLKEDAEDSFTNRQWNKEVLKRVKEKEKTKG